MRATLKEHTLICGFGRNGRQAAHRLSNHGHPFVVIEQNQELIQAHEKIHFIAIDALPKKYLNRSLSDLEIRQNTRFNVVGFRNAKDN